MTAHFNDAEPGQCRYALWSGRARTGLVCGAPVKPHSSWCEEHHALVYTSPTKEALQQLDAVAGRIVGSASRHQSARNVHPDFEDAR